MSDSSRNVTIAVMGAAVRIETNDTPLAEWLERVYPPSSDAAAHHVRVSVRGRGAQCSVDGSDYDVAVGSLMTWLSGRINYLASEIPAGTHVPIHAAALQCDDDVVMLCGKSGSGKSTLTAGLVARGWGYATDEIVAFPIADEPLLTFDRPIGLKEGSWETIPHPVPSDDMDRIFGQQRFVTPDEIGGAAVHGPLPSPTLIVFPHYDAALEPRSVDISPAQSTQRLLESSYRSAAKGQARLDAIARVAIDARSVDITYPDLRTAVDQVRAALRVEVGAR